MAFIDDVLADLTQGHNDSPTGEVAAALRRSTSIQAQNVVNYYATEIANSDEFRKQLGALTPPFAHLWIEIGHPNHYRIDRTTVTWPDNGFQRSGIYLRTVDGSEPGVRWKVIYTMFFEYLPHVLIMPSHGKYSPYPVILGEFLLDHDGMIADDRLGRFQQIYPKFPGPGVDDVLMFSASGASAVMLLTLSFLNCKNVSLDKVTPVLPIRTPRQKRQNQWPSSEREYHTITIHPLRDVTRPAVPPAAWNGALQQRNHIVRGHFHTYSKEKPLFGKAGLSGKFWIPQRMQGDTETGTIETDYRIDV